MPEPVPLEWVNNKLRVLDQTRLPSEEIYRELDNYLDLVTDIKRLAIRGAPAIGVAAAYGVALGCLAIEAKTRADFLKELRVVMKTIGDSRPTARNLFWALERMEKKANAVEEAAEIQKSLVEEARKIHTEQIDADRKLSRSGATLIKDEDTILTHCNAGALATAGYGTALGVIKYAFSEGKMIKVIATETRPLLQGARLTVYELKKAGIPLTLITDSMAGALMRQGKVNCVIVGADRIAGNGDTANKIGTYTLAVLAKEHGLPFYVAAPTSTMDILLKSGDWINIEERKAEEVTCFQGIRTTPEDIQVANPAFDVTPNKYISAIITEKGIIRKPFEKGIKEVLNDTGKSG